METILKIRDICKKYSSCYDDCPFYVDNECVLSIPPANWSDENLYLISKAVEQEPTTKNDLAVDCVSRQFMYELGATCIATRNKKTGHLMALGMIEDLPSVTPQEPVLDKIRAEIVELTKCPYGTECLGANCPSNTDCMICGDHVLEIIDKYKVESEEV